MYERQIPGRCSRRLGGGQEALSDGRLLIDHRCTLQLRPSDGRRMTALRGGDASPNSILSSVSEGPAMSQRRSNFFAGLTVGTVLALVSALPVLGGSVSAGGPWSYVRGPITCQFSGDHGSSDNHAFGRTTDFNNGCANLAVRLKSNPGPADSGWFFSTGSPSSWRVTDNRAGSTAVSSEHRAQNGWDGTYSTVQRPHAW